MNESINQIKKIARDSGAWMEDKTIEKGDKKIRIIKISIVEG